MFLLILIHAVHFVAFGYFSIRSNLWATLNMMGSWNFRNFSLSFFRTLLPYFFDGRLGFVRQIQTEVCIRMLSIFLFSCDHYVHIFSITTQHPVKTTIPFFSESSMNARVARSIVFESFCFLNELLRLGVRRWMPNLINILMKLYSWTIFRSS